MPPRYSKQGLSRSTWSLGTASRDDQLLQALQTIEDVLRGSSVEADTRRGDVERVGFGAETQTARCSKDERQKPFFHI